MTHRKNHLTTLKRIRANSFVKKDENALYLDRNERSIPYPAHVMKEVGELVSQCLIHRYPDVTELYEVLANWLQVKPFELFITEGVSGAIKAILETVASPGDNIITPLPSFALYPVYGSMFELENRHFGYTSDYKFDMQELKNAVDNNTAAVFLPNPNVPIEGGISLEEVGELATFLEETNTLIVVDEVYFPFGGPTAIKLLNSHENLLIMRSFSKAAGLAGIRVGYVIGNEDNIDYISKMRTGYETNRLSIEVVKYFVKNNHLILDYVDSVKAAFREFKDYLEQKGLEYTGGNWSNFIFVNLKNKERAAQVVEELKKKKIFVRGGWQAPFDEGFSVTGAPIEQYKVLMNALEEVL